jgi:hypothetical protein
MRYQDSRERHQQHDRSKIPVGIVGRLHAEQRIDIGRRAGLQQRKAVGRRLQHDPGSRHRGGTRLVLDDDRLIERARQLVGQEARDHVGVGAGRVRHHDRHLPGWVGLAAGKVRLYKRYGCDQQRR